MVKQSVSPGMENGLSAFSSELAKIQEATRQPRKISLDFWRCASVVLLKGGEGERSDRVEARERIKLKKKTTHSENPEL